MQPYFFPYLGYYRLLSLADIFVVYDCVQFPRRGWVHRNRFTMNTGVTDWVTLPTIKGGRDETKISDLWFPQDSSEILLKQFSKTRIFGELQSNRNLFELVCETNGSVSDYLLRTLEYIKNELGLDAQVFRSSTLEIPKYLKGQDRILYIVTHLGGSTYVNLSGGKHLYNEYDFAENGIELKILDPYVGPQLSFLERILLEEKEDLLRELR